MCGVFVYASLHSDRFLKTRAAVLRPYEQASSEY
jgi:hypothetical protein